MPFELGFKKVIMFSNRDPEVDSCRKEEVFRERVRKPGMKGKDSQASGQYSRNRRSALRLQVNEAQFLHVTISSRRTSQRGLGTPSEAKPGFSVLTLKLPGLELAELQILLKIF